MLNSSPLFVSISQVASVPDCYDCGIYSDGTGEGVEQVNVDGQGLGLPDAMLGIRNRIENFCDFHSCLYLQLLR